LQDDSPASIPDAASALPVASGRPHADLGLPRGGGALGPRRPTSRSSLLRSRIFGIAPAR